jgi:hypothetical protein
MRNVRSGARRRGQRQGQRQGHSPDEPPHRQFEADLLEQQIKRLEHSERAALKRLGCSTDLATIYAILTREQPDPWPTRMAERNRRVALHAMHTLARLQKVRGHVAHGHENARLAAYEALLAGMSSNVAALGRLQRRNLYRASERAARARAEQSNSRGIPKDFPAMVKRYRASNPDDSDRTIAKRLADRIGRPVNTVRRWLGLLKQNGSRTVGT